MIEIRITKELGNYEPKLIGPFTTRQVICLVIAIPICILIYTSLSPILTPDIAGFLCFFPAAIAALFGWIKPYGMKTEKFIQSMFINIVVAPSHRKYMTKNIHEEVIRKIETLTSVDTTKGKMIKKASTLKKPLKAVKKNTTNEQHVYY